VSPRSVIRTSCALAGVTGAIAWGSIARAQACFQETECTFEKPNVLVVLDYSSSMVQENFGTQTRWEAELDAVTALSNNATFTNDMHIALARFGHDPDTATGTTLQGDTSSPRITDGFAVDVPFTGPGGRYLECNAAGLRSTVANLPPPPAGGNGSAVIGTWTKGALQSALTVVQNTRARNPADTKRVYEVVLMTDGDWNCRASINQSDCDGDPGEPDDRPAPAAAALLAAGVRVHVVAFGDGTTSASLDAIAQMGGTGTALDAASPNELTAALSSILKEVRDAVVVPECIGGLPRVMVVMDASTSMMAGVGPGDSNWDKARYALAGNPAAKNPTDPGYVRPLFDRTVQVSGHSVAIEDVVHIGLMGFNERTTQKLMLQYAPCSRDNIEWAMDPYTSCIAPGCTDPYNDPDTNLVFTSVVSDQARLPRFVQTTTSFMPLCNPGGPQRCQGMVFNTYTGEGVNFARANVARYTANPGAFRLDPDSPFVNILITDGVTSPDDPLDAAAVLADMAQSGILTYVIGFGSPQDLDEAQLDSYASAGGTGTAVIVDPDQGDSANALADRLANVIQQIKIDPCCQLNDCSKTPEPILPFCGNGTVDDGEACDDGPANGALGGTCAYSCARAVFCGDGVVQDAEECDDANRVETDGCSSQCRLSGSTGGSGGAGGGGASGAGANAGAGANGAGANGAGASAGTGSGANGAGANGAGGSSGSSGSGSGARSGRGTGSSGSGEADGGLGPDGGPGANGARGADSGSDATCACKLGTAAPGSASWFSLLAILALRARRSAGRRGGSVDSMRAH
jgi:cysteine-rich repeat protein